MLEILAMRGIIGQSGEVPFRTQLVSTMSSEIIKDILQFFDVVALISIIFLTGAAFQRLRNVEAFIKNHKIFHDKVVQLEIEYDNLTERVTHVKADIREIRKRCFELHSEKHTSRS